MNKVFLIGNGKSREHFDLNLLKDKGLIIGCNALYREFSPDILVCQDAKMATEIYKSGYKGKFLANKGLPVKFKDVIYYKPGNARTSGVLAMKYIARILRPDICYLLGMDADVTNVYRGTDSYRKAPTHKFSNKILEQYLEVIDSSNFIVVGSSWGNNITYKEFETGL